MGKIVVVVVALVVLVAVFGLVVRRRERGSELIVTEARGYEPVGGGTLEDQARALMRRGQKIQAIKLVREHTRLGLKEAKDAVEALEATGRLRLPGADRAGAAKLEGLAPAQVLAQARMLKTQRKAIEAIKLIRQHTGLGLKEAKDLYDSL